MSFTDEQLWLAARKKYKLTDAKMSSYHRKQAKHVLKRIGVYGSIEILVGRHSQNGPVEKERLKASYPWITDKLIDDMKRKGTIFEPRAGYLMNL